MTARREDGTRPTAGPPGAGAGGPAAEAGHQAERLRAMLAAILPGNRFYARKFAAAGVDVGALLTSSPLSPWGRGGKRGNPRSPC